MLAQSELQARAQGGPVASAPDSDRLDPSEALTRLNHALLNYSLNDCEFVTAVYAEYNESTRTLRWSRAGAPPPILLCLGAKARRLESPGMPLGVNADVAFTSTEVPLGPGDRVVLHTDGLETLHAHCTGSRDEQMFLEWIEKLNEKELQSALREAADRCVLNSQLPGERDDMTLLMLRVAG
jgi:serine phosphatase RsbU (regulator of sigma subunit)